jgi:hypothetical protein
MKKIDGLVALNSVLLGANFWFLDGCFTILPVWLQGLFIILINVFLPIMMRAAKNTLSSFTIFESKDGFVLAKDCAAICAYILISASLIQIDISLTGTLIFEGQLGIFAVLRGINLWLAISCILFFVFHGQSVFRRKRGRLKA